ncbi:cGMP-gated cation channel alpha-1-like isoform X2 [Engraulis encrasicolus]|uniref:cGMP-gated cation channel alpha-1-like isoform X2 n=1 Tax=Engraulis encrasicolus TaxID=184585 RepID=UPI002FD40282
MVCTYVLLLAGTAIKEKRVKETAKPHIKSEDKKAKPKDKAEDKKEDKVKRKKEEKTTVEEKAKREETEEPDTATADQKKPGKIPYFQCVVYPGKSKQGQGGAPWRPLGPNMTPAMTTAMRAAMEQRASLMEARARAGGQ